MNLIRTKLGSEAPGITGATRLHRLRLHYLIQSPAPKRFYRSQLLRIERGNRSLCLLVLLQIPPRLDRAAECAVRILLLVCELDLGEVERDLIGRNNVAMARAAGLV